MKYQPCFSRFKRHAFPRTVLFAAAFLPLGVQAAEPAAAAGDRFLSRVRQLTLDGRRAGEGYFSPEGDALVFQSERDPDNPFFQIFTLDLATGDTRRVSPGSGKTTCAFFRPGSDEILFASTHLDPEASARQERALSDRREGRESRYAWDYDDAFDIFSVKRDGSGLQRLTAAPGYDAEASYSPDGEWIVLCSMRDRPPPAGQTEQERRLAAQDPAYYGEIYLMKADGSQPRRLTDWPGYDGGPFFSPDGKRIIWRHFEPGGTLADIYTMALDGSDRRRLTEFGCMSWAPYFHPSGEYVCFSANKLGFENFELFLVDSQGLKEPVRVTFTEGFDGLPVFDPKGERLCWTSTRHQRGGRLGQLYLAQWDHAAALAALESSPSRRAGEQPAATGTATAPAPAGPSEKKGPTVPASSPEISEADLRAHVTYLSSDAMQGRLTGSAEIARAGAYIASCFEQAGLKPAGTDQTFFQPFTFVAGVQALAEGNRLVCSTGGASVSLERGKDYEPLALSTRDDFTGPVVFAGYGLITDDYDSYGDLDVKGKCVLVLRYFPEDVSVERRTQLMRYASIRAKAMNARERGAKAMLLVSGPNSPKPGEIIALASEGAAGHSGIAAASISLDVARKLLSTAGVDLAAVQKDLDREDPHARSAFALPGAEVRLSVALEQDRKQCRNVLGLLTPENTAEAPEYIVVGAHYDHLGHGDAGSALGFRSDQKQVYNGADDNASGTAAVLELAAGLAARFRQDGSAPRRAVLFAAWSGEELGLLGSDHFIGHAPIDLRRVAAYVNFDMVGRLENNRLIVQGVGSSPEWTRLLERRNVSAGFDLVLQADPYLPTDSTSFYRAGIPTLAFFTGSHQDYHRPTDDAEKLAWDGLERITRFSESVISDLAARPDRLTYARVERQASPGGGSGMRLYTGTEPDYAYAEGDGMKLKGVVAGGPAERAGLKPGDLIVKFGDVSVHNVHEYAHALSVLKPGKPLTVVVQRGNETIELSLTPEARGK